MGTPSLFCMSLIMIASGLCLGFLTGFNLEDLKELGSTKLSKILTLGLPVFLSGIQLLWGMVLIFKALVTM